MIRLRFLVPAVLALSLASTTIADAPQPVKIEELLKTGSSWDGTPYKAYPAGQPEVSVVKVTLPPHTQMQWHTHPMPNVGYVLSGELTVERKDGTAKRHITTGQAIPETVGTIHRGVTGDSPAILIVFYAGAKGMPLSQPAGGN